MNTTEGINSGDPAFGGATLNNCEREQIHLPGSIQPHGALLVINNALSDGDLTIVRASQNAIDFLELTPGTELVGASLASVSKGFSNKVRELLASQVTSGDDSDPTFPALLTLDTPHTAQVLDCIVHRSADRYIILEFEQNCGMSNSVSTQLHQHIERISNAASLQSLCDITTDIFKQLFGYDRVMVYRFAKDGHGQVFAESREPHMESYRGNHYPASDIPEIARKLYKINRVRLLPDVAYKPSILQPQPQVSEAEWLDMSHCHLRSISPMHLEYLQNMGVSATLVASLIVGDQLWGLVTCNHSNPKSQGYEARTIAELLTEIVSTRISALDSLEKARMELVVQRIEKNMIEAISKEGEWTSALFDRSGTVLQPLDATGAALVSDDGIHTVGKVPADSELRRLATWLDQHNKGEVFCSPCIGIDHPELASIAQSCPGVIAGPVTNIGGEYLIWFRPEHVQSVIWAGDPRNPKLQREQLGAPAELTPRKSFELWTEELNDTSRHWSDVELSAARLISASVADVMQQFRAMRVMIAHNQLESLTFQIRDSELPALIADAEGKILLTNHGFNNLMWQENAQLAHISDLPHLFQEEAFARHNLIDLLEKGRPWRGSATLDAKPVMVRADPLFSAPGKALGYVILLTDVSDRQLAENARKRFPDYRFRNAEFPTANLSSETRSIYENLFSAVLDNAQMAAMEISDGIDAQRIPNVLKSVEASVSRTSRLINCLLQHSNKP